jgi:BirA family biotin operon repressor/biotin-[acetyl-CoA-carboxylase] ligase
LPEAALALLDAPLRHWLGRLEREGFAPLRAAWLARATFLGRSVEATLSGERIEGTFEDVDEQGALVLRTADGARRHLSAADIRFPD